MSSFEKALTTELDTITQLGNRVYPIAAPSKSPTPYVAYETSGRHELRALSGSLDAGELTCSLDIVGKSYSDMKATEALVRAKLKTFEGRVIGTGGPLIQSLVFAEYNPEMWEQEVDLYRKVLEFTVFF